MKFVNLPWAIHQFSFTFSLGGFLSNYIVSFEWVCLFVHICDAMRLTICSTSMTGQRRRRRRVNALSSVFINTDNLITHSWCLRLLPWLGTVQWTEANANGPKICKISSSRWWRQTNGSAECECVIKRELIWQDTKDHTVNVVASGAVMRQLNIIVVA